MDNEWQTPTGHSVVSVYPNPRHDLHNTRLYSDIMNIHVYLQETYQDTRLQQRLTASAASNGDVLQPHWLLFYIHLFKAKLRGQKTTNTHAHTHTHTHTHIYIHIHIQTYLYIHTYIHTIYIQIYKIHTYIHTYIYIIN